MAHWYFLRTPRGGSSLYLVRSLLVRSASLSTLWFRSKLPKMTENDENFKKGRGWQKFPRWKFFKFSKEFNGIFSFIIDPFIFEKKWCQWGGDIPAGRVPWFISVVRGRVKLQVTDSGLEITGIISFFGHPVRSQRAESRTTLRKQTCYSPTAGNSARDKILDNNLKHNS